MHDKQEWDELLQSIQVYLRWAIASLVDAGFLSLWIVTQWIVNTYIVEKLILSGVDQWQLNTFQFVFAIATLVPIISYVIKDIAIIMIRTWRTIRNEMNRLERTSVTANQISIVKEEDL